MNPVGPLATVLAQLRDMFRLASGPALWRPRTEVEQLRYENTRLKADLDAARSQRDDAAMRASWDRRTP